MAAKTMESYRSFINYPTPRKAPKQPKAEEAPEENSNPVMRGSRLILGASMISAIPSVQKFLWNNAKFGLAKAIPELKDYDVRYEPNVIPVIDGNPIPDLLDFSDNLAIPPALPPSPANPRYFTIADYHALYQAGEVTPLDVVTALIPLTRRSKTPAKPANKYEAAWVDGYGKGEELALLAARESTKRWKQGKPLGIMDGVPFSVKDNIDVEGWVTHNGMQFRPSMKYFKPAVESARPVKRMQDEGGIVVGKSSMHELASDTCGCNPSWGTPTNFHNGSYYPGGSSSGTASAISAGLVPIGIATDAGGSIRIPSAFNGLYGLKPTHNRTESHLNTLCVTGPMASNIADLTIAYRLMSQSHPDDPIQQMYAPSIPPSLQPKPPRKVLAVDRAWWSQADPAVLSSCEAALDHFSRRCGYTILDVTIPYLRESQLAHTVIAMNKIRTRHFADIPKSASTPNPLNYVRPTNRVLLSVASQTNQRDLTAANKLRCLIMQHLATMFEAFPGMMLATPTTPLTGWKRNAGDDVYGVSDTNLSIRNMVYCFLSNVTGCPSLSVPVGYVSPDAAAAAAAVTAQKHELQRQRQQHEHGGRQPLSPSSSSSVSGGSSTRSSAGSGGRERSGTFGRSRRSSVGAASSIRAAGSISEDHGRLPIGMMVMGEWGTEETLLAWGREAETYLKDSVEGGRVVPEGWLNVPEMARKGLGRQTGVNASAQPKQQQQMPQAQRAQQAQRPQREQPQQSPTYQYVGEKQQKHNGHANGGAGVDRPRQASSPPTTTTSATAPPQTQMNRQTSFIRRKPSGRVLVKNNQTAVR